MSNFIQSFKSVSVDSILNDFSKKVEQLHQLVAEKERAVSANHERISILDKENKAHSDEIARAERVAAKIGEILS